MAEMGLFQAATEAIADEMESDPTVMLWGENVEDPYGGLLQQYAGLSTRFDSRVKDSPLAETAIVGAAMGAAMGGLRPVVDIQIADFSFVAMEEIVRAPRWRHTHGAAGDMRMPIVIKTLVGGYMGVGANHSQVPTGYWWHTPGLKVAFPTTPSDAYGLMRTAIQDDDVVMFCLHKLYAFESGEVTEQPVPFGRAAIRREGGDATVVALGYMTTIATQAADLLAADDIEVEIIDPRTLEPFDLGTVMESVEKSGHLVVVDEDHSRSGAAAEICMQVQEAAAPGVLLSPPRRVATGHAPLPDGPAELQLLPSARGVADAVRDTLR